MNFKGKRVLVTGHTGFKGGWLTLLLKQLGAEVFGYALAPETTPSFFAVHHLDQQCHSTFSDIRDREAVSEYVSNIQPELIFHLAAQPLVRHSYAFPYETYDVNVMGTLALLEAARATASVKAFVNVTSDKCYLNQEKSYAYVEGDALGGHDLYSSSKACSEVLTASYRQSFLNKPDSFLLASARAGNVIGGGDWSVDRLIPDCMRSLSEGKPILLRYPEAVRPWQHVLEPLFGYLLLADKLLNGNLSFAEAFNFGPDSSAFLTVGELVKEVVRVWGGGEVQIESVGAVHEATLLQLDSTKAKTVLGFSPTFSTMEALSWTIEWYQRYFKGEEMTSFTTSQIQDYLERV